MKNIDQKLYASMARKILALVPHVMSLYDPNKRNDYYVVHKYDYFEFRLTQMYGHLSFAYVDKDSHEMNEVFSLYKNSVDKCSGWDGGHYGFRSYLPGKYMTLYDHYTAVGGHDSAVYLNHYEGMNKISNDLAAEMFPDFYNFTLTEEDHFQKSLIYDLMSYEDMKMWHDVIANCPEIDDGMVFFSLRHEDMFDEISTALVNMEALQKRSYE